jgi:hypothetical protein
VVPFERVYVDMVLRAVNGRPGVHFEDELSHAVTTTRPARMNVAAIMVVFLSLFVEWLLEGRPLTRGGG